VVKLSNEKIHDYIDGRLSRRERAVVAATLFANPELMREVMTMVLINDMVRCIDQHVLHEPVPDTLMKTLKAGEPQRQRPSKIVFRSIG